MIYIEILLKKSKSKVLFVILVGPYQVGKSSKIAALTGIEGIPIGNQVLTFTDMYLLTTFVVDMTVLKIQMMTHASTFSTQKATVD